MSDEQGTRPFIRSGVAYAAGTPVVNAAARPTKSAYSDRQALAEELAIVVCNPAAVRLAHLRERREPASASPDAAVLLREEAKVEQSATGAFDGLATQPKTEPEGASAERDTSAGVAEAAVLEPDELFG